MTVQVVPAILEKDKKELIRKIRSVGVLTDQIQIDIIDGKFAANETIKIEELADLNEDVNVNLHLMTEEPIKSVIICKEIGIESIIGQIELMADQKKFIEAVKKEEIKVGLGLDLKTPLDFLEEEVIEDLDSILLMSVKAGFSGQRFDSNVLKKIKTLREKYGFKGNIWIDGGINTDTIKSCVQAGGNLLAVGSSLWESDNVKTRFKRLEKLALQL